MQPDGRATGDTITVEGTYFDELERGQVFADAPGVTLTEGRAAAHQAILGERLRLALDDHLARAVTGGPFACPALVWDVAIGQSTLATQHVRANLFYRNLMLLRQPAIGDTLRTTTRVVGLRENTRREGRAPTGLAALHMQTTDQADRPVLDFYRCAMLPLRGTGATGHADDLDAIGEPVPLDRALDAVALWDLGAWPPASAASAGRDVRVGEVRDVIGGDVVSSAPELARLTTNLAAVHHDAAAAGGSRLVYGGHTIGIALAQVSRALPELVTVLGWESCDHLGPVREGDTLRGRVTVTGRHRHPGPGRVLDLRAELAADVADAADGAAPRPVLDWRFTALLA